MGRIKTRLIKRFGKKLFGANQKQVKPDFEANKKLVTEFAEISSKKHRNILAGYLTKLYKAEAK